MIVAAIVGTRPEAIKMAPVIRALRGRGCKVRVVLTGQHSNLVNNLLHSLGIAESVNLHALREGQTLSQLLASLVAKLDQEFADSATDIVLVQGDTSSALAGALVAFNRKIPVGHIEAGLRSGSIENPFPEEMNRTVIATLAAMHFAPTDGAKKNLLQEGVRDGDIWITGNTVIDNLYWSNNQALGKSAFQAGERGRKVLLTMHRRENQGEVMVRVAEMLRRLSSDMRLSVVLPIHPSPAVQEALLPVLSSAPNVRIVEPLEYLDFIATLADCDFVLTDSGGVQEEAPALNKPVLILRTTTERPEGVDSGCAELVGIDPPAIEQAIRSLVNDSAKYLRMANSQNPYGAGQASQIICDVLSEHFPAARRDRY